MLDGKKLGFADFREQAVFSIGNGGANDRAALMQTKYPNRRRLKIYAHAELRELEEDADLAAAPPSPKLHSRGRACGLDSPAAYEPALHRA